MEELLRHRSKNYNSAESRKKRSDRARRGAAATNAIKAARREPMVDPLKDLFRVTTENLVTGKVTVLLFHPGTRKNNLRIDMDGRHWKTCGVVGAERLIIHSLFSAARRGIDYEQHA